MEKGEDMNNEKLLKKLNSLYNKLKHSNTNKDDPVVILQQIILLERRLKGGCL